MLLLLLRPVWITSQSYNFSIVAAVVVAVVAVVAVVVAVVAVVAVASLDNFSKL